MSAPWLSIVVWDPGSPAQLAQTLDSLLLSELGESEALVVDGRGDAAGTLSSYARRLDLRSVTSEAPGSVVAWEEGVAAARGAWVLPLRGGDLLRKVGWTEARALCASCTPKVIDPRAAWLDPLGEPLTLGPWCARLELDPDPLRARVFSRAPLQSLLAELGRGSLERLGWLLPFALSRALAGGEEAQLSSSAVALDRVEDRLGAWAERAPEQASAGLVAAREVCMSRGVDAAWEAPLREEFAARHVRALEVALAELRRTQEILTGTSLEQRTLRGIVKGALLALEGLPGTQRRSLLD